MLKNFCAALAVMIFIFSATPTTSASPIVIPPPSPGAVFTAIGIGLPPAGTNINSSFYKSFIRQAATMDAFRRLAEAVKEVQVSPSTPNNILTSDVVVTEVEMNEKTLSLFSKIEIVSVKFTSDECCEVTVQGTLK